MSAYLLSLNPTKTEFLSLGVPGQLCKISDVVLHLSSQVDLSRVSIARNLGVLFYSTLSMSDQISAISKPCFSHIRDLRRIWSTLDLTTANTIATTLIHSKIDYCNSLLLNHSAYHLNRLQLVLNSAARVITNTRKFDHRLFLLLFVLFIGLKSLNYKVISLTYQTVQFDQPTYLTSSSHC